MSFVPMIQGSGLTAWALLSRTRETQQAASDATPQVARDVKAFRERIEGVQTVDDLMNDRTLLRVTLGAFGLESDLNNRAFIRRVLESDLDDPASLASRLNDQRYSSLAKTFGFGGDKGPVVLSSDAPKQRFSSPDELLSNPTALRSALKRFGLERDVGNVFFLQKILESDAGDPQSFVNRLGDSRYTEFRKAFNFGPSGASENRATDFYLAFKDKVEGLNGVDDLLGDPELLKAAVAFFDLPSDDPTRLRLVLESDTTDPTSFVNQSADKRYHAFSDAFRFGWPNMNQITDPEVLLANDALRANALEVFDLSDAGDDVLRAALNSDLDDPASYVNQPDKLYLRNFVDAFQNGWPEEQTKAQRFVAVMSEDYATVKDAEDVVFNLDLYDATVDVFGMMDRANDRIFVQKIMEADPDKPGAVTNHYADKRFTALARAFNFSGPEGDRKYPEGFTDAILARYSDRQFEVAVGESDPNLRIALAFERELTDVVNARGSNDGRWFSIMGSPPLRKVFETVFQLPSSFGTLDLDRQLEDFKTRSQSTFGTSDLKDLLRPENLEEVRRRFLAISQISQTQGAMSPGSVVLQLLAQR